MLMIYCDVFEASVLIDSLHIGFLLEDAFYSRWYNEFCSFMYGDAHYTHRLLDYIIEESIDKNGRRYLEER